MLLAASRGVHADVNLRLAWERTMASLAVLAAGLQKSHSTIQGHTNPAIILQRLTLSSADKRQQAVNFYSKNMAYDCCLDA
jgi:hypothetical protein